MLVAEIAKKINGDVSGNGTLHITGIAKIEEANEADITFFSNPKYEKFLLSTRAQVIIVPRSFVTNELPKTFIKVDDPYQGFLAVLQMFNVKDEQTERTIHPTALVGSSSIIGKNVAIAPYVVIGNGCTIADNVTILANTVIGDGVEIGEGTFIYANVTIREATNIGKRVILQPGAVIGSDGFGFSPNAQGVYEKIPQVGKVIIEDDVEIGANTTIDRATMGETRIKRGTKIDNLVQIAHNVVIGEDTVIAAQTGISGSTKIGKRNIIGGQAGIAGHLETAEQSTIAAQSGITKSIKESGKTFSGYPAKEHSKAKRIEASLRQLPELLKEIELLRNKIDALEKKVYI